MESLMYTFDENIVSDLYKEARSHRPRETFWFVWNLSTDAEKQGIWDGLLQEADYEADMENQRKERAVKQFAKMIEDTIALGASNEEAAIDWLLEAEGFTLYDYQYGADYIAYHFDLPYENEWRKDLECIAQAKVCELYETELAFR